MVYLTIMTRIWDFSQIAAVTPTTVLYSHSQAKRSTKVRGIFFTKNQDLCIIPHANVTKNVQTPYKKLTVDPERPCPPFLQI